MRHAITVTGKIQIFLFVYFQTLRAVPLRNGGDVAEAE
jgi:hypothetical protein